MPAKIAFGALLLGLPLILPAVPFPQQTSPKTVFADEFSGSELDRSHWNVVTAGRTVNNEQQAYVDAPEVLSVTGGALVIRPRFREGFTLADGRRFDFISGRIDTRSKVTFTYGTVAARMKLVAAAGLWPAFWALGEGRWPESGEIDIMENVGDPAWTSMALHGPGYSGNTPLVKRAPFPTRRDATDWHVYAVDWTADALLFTVDKQEVYRVTRAMVEAHGRWVFDTPKYLILNLALGGNFPAKVNGAGAPYPGLSEAAVQSIKSDEAKVLVDWVRVTGT